MTMTTADYRSRREQVEAWNAYLVGTRRFAADRLGYELAEPVLWAELQALLHRSKLSYLHRKGAGR